MALSKESAALLAKARADYGTKVERVERAAKAKAARGAAWRSAIEAAHMPGRRR